MRNPWSSERYRGPWHDGDKNWTPALLRKVGHKKGNDGIFFFPAKYFNSPFTTVSISYYDESWQTVRYENPKTNRPSKNRPLKLTMYNPTSQTVIVQFEHTPYKALAPGCKKFKANYNIYVGSRGPVGVPAGSYMQAIKLRLPRGKHSLKIIDWLSYNGNPGDFVIHTYAKSRVSLYKGRSKVGTSGSTRPGSGYVRPRPVRPTPGPNPGTNPNPRPRPTPERKSNLSKQRFNKVVTKKGWKINYKMKEDGKLVIFAKRQYYWKKAKWLKIYVNYKYEGKITPNTVSSGSDPLYWKKWAKLSKFRGRPLLMYYCNPSRRTCTVTFKNVKRAYGVYPR